MMKGTYVSATANIEGKSLLQDTLCNIAILQGTLGDDVTKVWACAYAHTHAWSKSTGSSWYFEVISSPFGFDHVVFPPSWIWSHNFDFFCFILASIIEWKSNFRDLYLGPMNWNRDVTQLSKLTHSTGNKIYHMRWRFSLLLATFSFESWNNLLLYWFYSYLLHRLYKSKLLYRL